MRHQKFSQRLSRPSGHRRSTLRNLTISLLKYQSIKTTKAKAKFAQQVAERLISLSKENSLTAHRAAYRILNNRSAVNELFAKIAPLFKNKTSGFTRIIHLSNRRGDGAQIVILELTQKLPRLKPKAEKERLKKEKVSAKEQTKPKPEGPPEKKARLAQEKFPAPKKLKPKKFLGGLRRLFKKERDSL
jgi:large subunit ribosomal protein L17